MLKPDFRRSQEPSHLHPTVGRVRAPLSVLLSAEESPAPKPHPMVLAMTARGCDPIYVETQHRLDMLFEAGDLGLKEWAVATEMNWFEQVPMVPAVCAACGERAASILDWCAKCINDGEAHV